MNNLKVICPICKNRFEYYSAKTRPFCSDKCRLLDLGKWLNESYAVPVKKLNETEQQTLEQLINEKNSEENEDSQYV